MLLRFANEVPVNFALACEDLVGTRPKIGVTNAINLLPNIYRNVMGCKMINGNGGEDPFDEDRRPTGATCLPCQGGSLPAILSSKC